MKRNSLWVGLVALTGLVVAGVTTRALAEDPATGKAPPASSAATTPSSSPSPMATEHRAYTSATLTWVDAPAAMPKGAKVAVVQGDPAAPGLFTMRIKLPAGYKIAPHFHPADEHVTVISGELNMGLGDAFDESKGHALPPGAFSIMPKGMHHFAWTKVESEIQVHGIGPWGITYLNPQDDPRNMKQAAK